MVLKKQKKRPPSQKRRNYKRKLNMTARVSKCTICYEDGINVKIIPCSHLFHRDCIENWIRSNTPNRMKCPICRNNIKKLVDFIDSSIIRNFDTSDPLSNPSPDYFVAQQIQNEINIEG